MAQIRLDDKQIELSVRELWIRTDGESGVRFDPRPATGNLAIITVNPHGTATARRASGVTVLVNGVALLALQDR
jgi:hypothetical protein